jgi:hypothetical protein
MKLRARKGERFPYRATDLETLATEFERFTDLFHVDTVKAICGETRVHWQAWFYSRDNLYEVTLGYTKNPEICSISIRPIETEENEIKKELPITREQHYRCKMIYNAFVYLDLVTSLGPFPQKPLL